MFTSMASICRALRKALAVGVFAWKPPTSPTAVFPSIHHSQHSTVGMWKHALYFLQGRQLPQPAHFYPQSQPQFAVYNLGNSSSNNYIEDQLLLVTADGPPNCHLRTQDLDIVKRKLQGITDAYISYKQLLEICVDCTQNSCEEDGIEIINLLEKSGAILQIGETVYLHPQQVVRAVKSVLSLYMDESGREELRNLEKEKAEIDVETKKLVRKELWCGLGFFGLQIIVLLELTFWEFSWDLMEPVCFFLASVYFFSGYAFFLKTAKDPTFESFYAARLKTKQKEFMETRNFKLERYRELQRIWGQS